RADVRAYHAADDEEERRVQVDLGQPFAEVVDGKGGDGDRDDGDQGVRVGKALRHPRPKHLEGHQHKAAAHAEQAAEQPAKEPDRRKDAAAPREFDYSVVRGGVSGWFVTTE